jgi:hypothetical protein
LASPEVELGWAPGVLEIQSLGDVYNVVPLLSKNRETKCWVGTERPQRTVPGDYAILTDHG